MKRISLAALATSALLLPFGAFAQTTSLNVGLGAHVNAGGVGASTTVQANLEAKATARGDQEIDRRVQSLNDLVTRINAMTRLSSDEKASLSATLTSEVSTLTNLKAKIDADTTLDDLKTDIHAITTSYRVYMLVMPQGRIIAAADRVQAVATTMTQLGTKLNARIQADTTGNAAALASAYADMQAKIADANTQSAAAVSGTATLKPDNGDATIAASNKAALEAARTAIKTAVADLHAAEQDIKTIVLGLKGTSVTASSTTSTNVETH